MNQRVWFLALSLGLALSCPAWSQTATGPSRLDYADYLLRQGDYFRSISVLKEVAYYSKDPQQQQYLRLKLGEAYRKSNRTTAAVYYYSQVIGDSSQGEWDARANVGMAMTYIQANSLPMARMMLRDSEGQEFARPRSLVDALIAASEGEYAQAGTILSMLEPNENDPVDVKVWAQRFETVDLPEKSPPLAGLMSLFFPGAGQAYSGHYFDALLSFALVSSFALASYAAYRYDDEIGDSYVTFGAAAIVTGVFHAANVLGAVRTAQYRNFRVKENFLGDFRLKVLSMDF